MSAWLFSISTVIILSGLIDLILSEGETKKYVKGIAGIITIAVIIAPLVGFIDSNDTVFDFLNAEENGVDIDDAFVFAIIKEREEQAKHLIEQALLREGIEAEIKVYSDNLDGVFYIKNVTCSFDKSVIKDQEANIDINKKIKNIIKEISGVPSEEIIIIYAG